MGNEEIGIIIRMLNSLRNLWSLRNLIWLTAFWLLLLDAMFLIPYFVAQEEPIRLFMLDDYAVFIVSSFLLALLMVIEIQVHRMRGSGSWGSTFLGGTGILSALTSALFGTASCTLCLGILINLFGFGTSFFLVRHSIWFGIGSMLFLLLALAFSLRRLNSACEACRVRL
jgi:hypothetical protein